MARISTVTTQRGVNKLLNRAKECIALLWWMGLASLFCECDISAQNMFSVRSQWRHVEEARMLTKWQQKTKQLLAPVRLGEVKVFQMLRGLPYFKGIVHRKLKIHSLSTHCEVFGWSFSCNKTTEKNKHASILLMWCLRAPTFIFDSKQGHLLCVWSVNVQWKWLS